MFNSPALDIAVGLIFIYLLLSLISSATKEIIELWLKKRATNLETGIKELLSDSDGKNLVKQFFDHPLICCLYSGYYNPAPTWKEFFCNKFRTNLPSYIPASSFAQALIDIVLHPNGPPPAVDGATPAPPPSLRAAIEKVPNANVKRVLLAFADTAGDDLNRMRESIEAWFNSTMDRVSGWYKRWTQLVILVLGLGIAIGWNADTIAICASLSQDPKARQQLVEAASEQIKEQKSKETGGGKAGPAGDTKATAEQPSDPMQQLRENLKKAQVLGLPIGWDLVPGTVTGWQGWTIKVVGWLLTAVAISLGAPFWFDLLNKFMVVRATTKPQEKHQKEK